MSESQGIATPEVAEVKTEPTAQDPRLAEYAKKEQRLRQMQKEMQSERQKWQQKLAEYETNYIPKSKLKENPFEVLNETGLDYDTLAQQLMNQPNLNDPATKALMGKIRALEEKQTAAERAQQEQVKVQYDNAVKQITNDVKMLVSSNQEFETIKELGLEDSVVELIKDTFDQDGTLMDIEAACKQVEEEAMEQLLKAVKIQKLQSRLTPKPVETEAKASAVKTLTNAQSQTPSKKLSEKDRVARAIAAFKGQLT